MSNKHNLVVGQKVILVEDGNNSYRYNKNQGLPPNIHDAVVTSIGRKYFKVYKVEDLDRGFPWCIKEFHLDNLIQKSDFTPDYSLHFCRETYLKCLNNEKLYSEVKNYFTRGYSKPQDLDDSIVKTIHTLLRL